MSDERRRMRLEQLLRLAQTYRGCSRKQLGKELGRDPSKLIPQSGMPKLDMVMDLARLMDWSVQQVAAYLCDEEDEGHPEVDVSDRASFASLMRRARRAASDGHWAQTVGCAREAVALATSDEDRARARHCQAIGWNGMGRFDRVLAVARHGLELQRVPQPTRAQLQCDLAGAYYALWHLPEAGAIAERLVHDFRSGVLSGKSTALRVVRAAATFLAGHVARRQLCMDTDRRGGRASAVAALQHLSDAASLFEALGDRTLGCLGSAASSAGMAHTCEGGLLEVEVSLGRLKPMEALERIESRLGDLVNLLEQPPAGGIESYGWWCIFGCNIALRHLDDERLLQQKMAILTNKADEIGEYLDDWSIRERVFTLQYMQRQRFQDWTGVAAPMTMDSDDLRVMAGTMGRFTSFRATAWDMLQSAQIVK